MRCSCIKDYPTSGTALAVEVEMLIYIICSTRGF